MARPVFHGTSERVTELRAIDEGAVPANAPATSRLFVLPVAARRWVSTDNKSSSTSMVDREVRLQTEGRTMFPSQNIQLEEIREIAGEGINPYN